LITVLANDDGPGVLSFNNSGHIFLREPTSLYMQESVAVLTIIREPAQGLFGTVAVQFVVTEVNSSTQSKDLIPSKGFVVLEEGVRAKALHISAILDTEPEMDEHFVCTLFNPTGGARLGTHVQTLITILQNQAPLGLFSISALENSGTSIDVEESNRSIYLNVSRMNGLDLAVSVQWETVSETAFGMRGVDLVFSVFQSFLDQTAFGWCFFTVEDSVYGVMLRKASLFVYRWQGTFIPVGDLNIENPETCEAFNIGVSPYLIITHGGKSGEKPSINSVYTLTSGFKLLLVQTIIIPGSCQVQHFTSDSQDYFIIASQRNDSELTQVFRWNGSIFASHQTLPVQGNQNSIDIFIWEMGKSSFRYFQSLDFVTVNRIRSFTPASGIVHVLLTGPRQSALYCWHSERNEFSFVLEGPAAHDAAFVTVKSLNSSKTLIALVEATRSNFYELTYISSQSDFIPSLGELTFEPGDKEAILAVNVLDDAVPEREESFRVQLKNPKGGAEIGLSSYVRVNVLSNDDAYGVIAFAQNSLHKQVEEMERDSLVTLNVERLKGTHGRITVAWEAAGSTSDVFPTSGVISFTEDQALSTITLTVLADDLPELSEVVIVTLTQIVTEGVEDPSKAATVDENRSKSVLTILPSDSPYGVLGWHTDSLFTRVPEPTENITILQLHIVRDKGLFGDISIHLIAKPNFLLHINNQATENEDYVLQDAVIIMKENIKETYAEVAILPDVGGVITAHELPPPLNILQVPVIRRAGSFETVHVYWKATPDSAGLEDFEPSHGTLQFADGQVTALIEIAIVDDGEFELIESFSICLMSVDGGRLGDDVVVTVVIPSNDSPFGIFGFEEKTVVVDESLLSDDPESYVTLTVIRSPGGKGAVLLHWAIEEKAKDDLSPLNGTLDFDETESQKTVTLHTLQDSTLGEDRRFTIELRAADDIEISPMKGSASIIIRGDKGASEVGIASSSRHIIVGEPSATYNGTGIISLVRGPGVSGEITVYWRIFPPSMGVFVETSGQLTIQDGQAEATVIIQALDDDIPEEKCSYEFWLTGISEGGVLNEASINASITMVASDDPYGRFSFSHEQLQVSEAAQRVNVTVVRSGGSFGRVRVWCETYSRTAEAGWDFVPISGELLFEARERVKSLHVEILDDNLPEGPEEFALAITKVDLQGRGYDFTIQENGLQIDQPPETGNISIVQIIIMKNDNAEGIIEFDPKYTAISVNIESMAKNNLTMVTEFILMGFTDHPEWENPLFLVFLGFYLVTILGNLGMVLLIQVDVQLHTPMYFFLSHLSVLDACYTSVITPQILATLAMGKTVISYGHCATQFFFFTICAGTECFLLSVMAYDRYVAISNPLLYTVAMSPQRCWCLIVGAYVCGVSGAILRTTCTFSLSFCENNEINFFFCDLPPLLKLACSDTTNTEIIIVFFGNFVILANALIIVISYLLIIKAVMRMKSSGGRVKTFSTCVSHLTAVALLFGTLIFMYIRSGSKKSLEEDKIVSVFYTVVIPMLNPLIYSLRNKDVKAAFKKVTVDTGADVTIIAPEFWHPNWPVQEVNVQLLGIGTLSQVKQSARWLECIGPEGQRAKLKPYVANIAMNLWGRDLLKQWNTQINIPPTSETNQLTHVSERNTRSPVIQIVQEQGRTTVDLPKTPTALPLKWVTDKPVWVQQWPLTTEKLQALEELVQEQLNAQHIEESTSPLNSPVFVIKKKSGKWRMVTDLRAINKVIQPMGSLQSGISLPTLLPKGWPLIVIDLKDCFFSIPLQVKDRERFAFTVPTYNNSQPVKRYQWRVLPQGMLNSPTLCQYFVQQPLEVIRKKFPKSIIYHYMDDILLADANADTLERLFEEVKKILPCWGLQIAPEKIQKGDSVNYLGYKIGLQKIRPQKVQIRRDRLRTLNDFQRLFGDISHLRTITGVKYDELSNLFKTLEGDKDLNSSRELTPEAEKELALVEKKVQDGHVDLVDPKLDCILVILPSRHSPTGILMQREDIILEWIFLPNKQSKKLKIYVEKISDLILKGKLRLRQLAGIDPAEIVVPLTKEEIEKLWAESEPWQRACSNFLGEINSKYPKSDRIELTKRADCILPRIVWETPVSGVCTFYTDANKQGKAGYKSEDLSKVVQSPYNSVQKSELYAILLVLMDF
ncbi:hypothetical protein STEG23_022841, partial [Scotinomys teguina]